jgi:RNA polymerase sigma-70 factor (ECF subfamily)
MEQEEGHKSKTEREIIESVLAGEQEDFRFLLMTYQNGIFALVMRTVGERDVAEELTQDVFVRAYNGLHHFRFESKFSTWLIRIAINVTNSYFASKSFRDRKRLAPLTSSINQVATDSAESAEILDESLKHLQDCIAKLKPHFREVVMLCGLERKSYEEASLILKIPVGTVGSRMNKAFKILKESYWQS